MVIPDTYSTTRSLDSKLDRKLRVSDLHRNVERS